MWREVDDALTDTAALAAQVTWLSADLGATSLRPPTCTRRDPLVEKHAKDAGLDVKVSYSRLSGAAQVQSAVASGAIDMGPFGTAPLLAAWAKAKDTPQQILAVSGITSLPLTLLSNQADEHSLADLKPSDRIAVPTLTSPQMQLLDMQSEKIFGRYDRLRGQVVVLSHADAVDALGEGASQAKDGITAYFASPPYTEIALRNASVHPILNSSDVIGGKFSFLILGATKATIDAQPRLPEVIDKAMDEAARVIHDDPRRAAQIYLDARAVRHAQWRDDGGGDRRHQGRLRQRRLRRAGDGRFHEPARRTEDAAGRVGRTLWRRHY